MHHGVPHSEHTMTPHERFMEFLKTRHAVTGDKPAKPTSTKKKPTKKHSKKN